MLKPMDIPHYFHQKKQRFMKFFNQFHSLINAVQQACQIQIDNECTVAKKVLKDTHPSIIHNQSAQMLSREPEALSRILDKICTLLKEQLLLKATKPPISQLVPEPGKQRVESRPISLGKSRKKSVQKFVTPVKADFLHNKTVNQQISSPVIGMPLLHQANSQNSYSSQGMDMKQKILQQTPVNLYRSNAPKQTLEPSRNQNLLTCEKLDRKIQQEALQMLSKVKLQRSPSRMRPSSNQKGKTIASFNNLQTDYNLLAKNLVRRFE